MSWFRWISLVAPVLALLATPGAAQGAPALLQDQIAEVVQTAIDSQAAIENPAHVLAAAREACALTGFALMNEGEAATVHVSVSGNPTCDVFTVSGGRKLVVDFLDVVNLRSGDVLRAKSGSVFAVARTSLYALEPQFVSRLVLDMARPVTHRIERVENQLRVFVEGEEAHQPVIVVEFDGGACESAPVLSASSVIEPSRTLASDLASLRTLSATPVAAVEAVDVETPRETGEVVITGPNGSELPSASELAAKLAQLRRTQRLERAGLKSASIVGVETARPDLRIGLERLIAAADTDAPISDDAPAAVPEEAAAPAESTDTVAPGDDAAVAEETVPSPEAEVEEAQDAPVEPPPVREEPPPVTMEANTELTSLMQSLAHGAQSLLTPGFEPPSAPPSAPKPKYQGNPMNMPVNLDFRDMEMANVVAILASMADINVIAGTELTGTVTLSLKDVPLRQAMDTVLRINGLGLIEEEGIYRIVPYNESVAAKRTTMLVTLENAEAEDVRQVIDDVLVGSLDQKLVSLSVNKKTNVLIISGPVARVNELIALAHQLDVAEPVLPTVTEAIKLNYADPAQLQELVKTMLSKEVGQVSADQRARFLVVTDVPAVVEQVRQLTKTLDLPVKQVMIDAMVVDAVLSDDAETGVDWLLNSVRRQSRRDAAFNPDRFVSNLQELGFGTDLGIGDTASALTFGILSSEIDLRGMIQAEVRSQNGSLLSNPVVVTVENKPARIMIAQEIPYIELVQSNAGGSQTNTEFKEIGTVLEVTPQVTHDDHILMEISGKESGTIGEFNGVPIEDKREVETTLRMRNGQTVFIGGLRKNDNDATVRKVPILGDIPGLNIMFRSNVRTERVNELMIFMTCKVVPDEVPDIAGKQREKFDEGVNMPMKPDGQFNLVYDTFHPGEMRDPIWKVRRSD